MPTLSDTRLGSVDLTLDSRARHAVVPDGDAVRIINQAPTIAVDVRPATAIDIETSPAVDRRSTNDE